MTRTRVNLEDGAVMVKKERLVSDRQIEPTLDLISRQNNRSFEVRERLEGILKHEWYNHENMRQGKNHLEALYHGLYNRIDKQAEIHYKSLIEVYDQDRAEKAIEVANKVGIQSKLFAVMEVEGINFLIKGADHDWLVWKIDYSDEEVPCEFLRRLTILRKNGIEFDGYAIAVPEQGKYQPLIQVMKQEAVKIGRKGLITLGVVAKAVAATVAASTLVLPFVAMILTDPVILGRYGRCWIELGRWE